MFLNKALSVIILATSVIAQGNIVEVLRSNGHASKLLTLITSSPIYKPLVDAISSSGPFTIFAPNDDAFSSANTTGITDFTNILQYHVVPGAAIYSTNLTDGSNFVNTLLTNTSLVQYNDARGQVLDVVKSPSGVKVFYGLSNATVVTADLATSNGVIHIVDKILIPPKSASATAVGGGLTKLVAALNAANLTDTVDKAKSVTIFAPLDAAFDAAPSNLSTAALTSVLTYHVVPNVYFSTNVTALKEPAFVPALNGGTIKVEFSNGNALVNSKKVVKADVLINSGVVHIIDGVLNPSDNMYANASASNGTASAAAVGSGASIQQASMAVAFFACVISFHLM